MTDSDQPHDETADSTAQTPPDHDATGEPTDDATTATSDTTTPRDDTTTDIDESTSRSDPTSDESTSRSDPTSDESTSRSDPTGDESTSRSDPTGDVRADGGALDAPPGHDDGHDDTHGLGATSSIKRWFVTTNHKDIGILYIVTSLSFLILGGILAMLMRAQLWTPRAPGTGPLSAFAYNQAVSVHGLVMVFWFLSPFAFGFANYVVPLQLGAKDLAFPRLNALSYWGYLASGILLFISFFQGGTFAGGWTMYAPLNLPTFTPSVGGSAAVLALMLFVASVTVSSVNFLTTMHRMRAEGLTLRRMPLFSWTILLTVWMMLFAFAALLAALLILSADRILGTMYFAQNDAAGSVLWTHLFWFFGHPEVYIVFFPALGVMAETFQTFTGRRIVGRKWFIAAMVLVALQSFIVWMHHMFLTSINLQIKTLFMATTIGISLPFDLMVFSLIYTMVKGRIRFKTPFLFSFGGLLLFILGGITGVFLGAVVLDYEFRGTYWVVAHFHYVMVGGVTALIGGLYYWYPKITGRMYDEFLGKVHFVTYFIGFNLLYFPMFVAWETPRRVFNYSEGMTIWHRLATIGAVILGASFLVMIYNLVTSAYSGEKAGDNPWKYSTTAEWAVSSPPPLENFPGVPTYGGGKLQFLRDSDELESRGDDDVGAGTAPVGDGGEPATDGSTEPAPDGGEPASATSATVVADTSGARVPNANVAEISPEATHPADEPHADGVHASHASIWPALIGASFLLLFTGLSGFTNAAFPSGTMGLVYKGATALGFLATLGSLVGMAQESFTGPTGPFGESWPFEKVSNMKTGMWIFLASDVVLFGAFIGAYVFLRFAAGWWDPFIENVMPGLINTYLLLTSSFTVILALEAAERESKHGVVAALTATLLLGLGFLGNKALEWQHLFQEGHWLDNTVRESTFFLTTGLHGAHVIVGLIITLYMIPRAWTGAYGGNSESIEHFGLYWHFVDIVWLFLFPLFYIL